MRFETKVNLYTMFWLRPIHFVRDIWTAFRNLFNRLPYPWRSDGDKSE